MVSRHGRFVLEHYLVLPIGAAAGVIWASTFAVSYFRMSEALAFAVNDVGMAFALAYVGQEVFEAAMPGGTLHPWRRTTLPIVAAIGGTLGAIAVYELYVQSGDNEVLAQGWPIVCAVDILFCLAAARAIFGRTAAATFILLLAITSDVIGLIVISGRHYLWTARHPLAAVLILLAIGASAIFRRSGVRSIWPHVVVSGTLAWFGCYWAGIHPALALLPIVPFLPHTPRNLVDLAGVDRGAHRSAGHFEHVFELPVQVFAFLFGLVNAGVLPSGFGAGTWAVLLGSLVGRPLGILTAVGLAGAVGLRLPRTVGTKETIVIALAASSGFGFGLFFAAAVFPIGPLLIETKMGTLVASVGVLLAIAVARLWRVGTVPLFTPASRSRRRDARPSKAFGRLLRGAK